MERIGQPTPQPSPTQHVINYDNHGSVWGTDAAETAEADITAARARGAEVHEWETTDRDGQPLRVVRIPDHDGATDICVFTTAPLAVTA